LNICDLSTHVAEHRVYIDRALSRVVDSGWFILGPEVGAFERSFSAYVGVGYCVAVGNGTDAIELALRAIGIQNGDRVATVANAGMYTSTVLQAIGASPIYMDVSIESHVVTIDVVVDAIRQGARAVVVTHLYGQAIPRIEDIATVCRESGIPLVEDCAQAHGALVNDRQVGSFGDFGCFSFYPTKNLGALGDGGAIVINDPILAEKLAYLRQYGWTKKYHVELPGRNSRLDELQAAVLSEFLPLLKSWNARRRHIASLYSTHISCPSLVLPPVGAEDYVAHLYVVRSTDREALRTHLNSLGIASDVHYPTPDHRQPVFGKRFQDISLPNTECLASEVLTLPCYPEMTDRDVQRVIDAVNSWKP
jgi:dTDP-4-amino-4,6-dideoxygalactose transaminase